MGKLIKYGKVIVTIVSVLNLIALFQFEYQFPKIPFLSQEEEETKAEESTDVVEPKWKFEFETDTLVYDGTTEFDLLEGVKLVNEEGQVSREEIFVRITTAENISSKVIEYSADTDEGRVTGTRQLQLVDYQGPSITVNPEILSVETKDMNSIGTVLMQMGELQATDGYGMDISQAIVATYTRDEANLTLIHCSFSITNLFQDTKIVNADIVMKLTKPLLILKDTSILVEKGSFFDAYQYIEAAINIDGASLLDRITIEGDVDVNVPGTYNVRYFTYNYEWVYSSPVDLKVIVTE